MDSWCYALLNADGDVIAVSPQHESRLAAIARWAEHWQAKGYEIVSMITSSAIDQLVRENW